MSTTTRLTAVHKRSLKTKLAALSTGGEPVTTQRMRAEAAVLGVTLTQAAAEKALTEFGYRASEDVEPSVGESGLLETSRIWKLAATARPLTPAGKAQALASRMEELTGAFVADVLEDPLLSFAELDEVAVEATRVFAVKLSEAVMARARFGAKSVLMQCADTSSAAFRGAFDPS